MENWPKHPVICELNTWVWLNQLTQEAQQPITLANVPEAELQRLLNKLPDLNPQQQEEVRRAFDRLLNKLLHPPLESLRDESRHGIPHALLDALARLFQLKD